MKTLGIIIVAVIFSLNGFCQQNDTTRLDVGNKKIIIIEKDEAKQLKGKEKLERGKMEFQAEKLELERQIDSLQQATEKADDLKKNELQGQIDQLKIQIQALDNGIKDIDHEITGISRNKKKDDADVEIHIDKNLDNDKKDDIRIDKFWNHRKGFHGHWAGFNLGLNNFVNADHKLELPNDGKFMELNTSRSWEIGLNIMEYSINLIEGYSGLVTGLGFVWNHYALENDYKLVEDQSGRITGIESEYKGKLYKNRLNTTYLTVPLLWEFQIPTGNQNHRFHISAGVTGSIKLGSNTKQYYKLDDKKNKDKVRDDYQLSPYRYGLMAQVGYRGLRFFATYSMVPLFEKNKGPELYPITVGLTLIDL